MTRVITHPGQAVLAKTSPVVFNISFSEAVTGVSSSLFTTTASTATAGTITVTSLSSSAFKVSVVASGVGSIVLGVSAPAGVRDLAQNLLTASGLTSSVSFGEWLSLFAVPWC